MEHRALAEGGGGRCTVLCEYAFFKRTGVYADAYRNAPFSRGIRKVLYSVLASDVTGIYAYLINACFKRKQRGTVIKVYIRDKRDLNARVFDVVDAFCRQIQPERGSILF